MARPERFELPTTWFEGTDAKSGFLINQQLRWPALNVCAAERRRELRIAAETLRFRHKVDPKGSAVEHCLPKALKRL